MNPAIAEKIVRWGQAVHRADELLALYGAEPENWSRVSSEHYKEYNAALHDLVELDGSADLPQVLVEFLRTRQDSSCTTCWIHSNPQMRHPACDAKREIFFAAQTALYNEALELEQTF